MVIDKHRMGVSERKMSYSMRCLSSRHRTQMEYARIAAQCLCGEASDIAVRAFSQCPSTSLNALGCLVPIHYTTHNISKTHYNIHAGRTPDR